jgi:hypothetical protein
MLEQSSVDKILRVRSNAASLVAFLSAHITRLEQLAEEGDSAAVLEQLSLVVPAFRPAVDEPLRAASPSFRHEPVESADSTVIDSRSTASAWAGRA